MCGSHFLSIIINYYRRYLFSLVCIAPCKTGGDCELKTQISIILNLVCRNAVSSLYKGERLHLLSKRNYTLELAQSTNSISKMRCSSILSPLTVLLLFTITTTTTFAFPHWLRLNLNLLPRTITPYYNVYTDHGTHYTYAGYGPQPTIPLTTSTPTPTTPPSPIRFPPPKKCHHDNCLRHLLRNRLTASDFCTLFTATPVPGYDMLAYLPGLGPKCSDDVERVVSACITLKRVVTVSSGVSTSLNSAGETTPSSYITSVSSGYLVSGEGGSSTSTSYLFPTLTGSYHHPARPSTGSESPIGTRTETGTGYLPPYMTGQTLPAYSTLHTTS